IDDIPVESRWNQRLRDKIRLVGRKPAAPVRDHGRPAPSVNLHTRSLESADAARDAGTDSAYRYAASLHRSGMIEELILFGLTAHARSPQSLICKCGHDIPLRFDNP